MQAGYPDCLDQREHRRVSVDPVSARTGRVPFLFTKTIELCCFCLIIRTPLVGCLVFIFSAL